MRQNNGGYIPALTGLRGVAAWWVVVYHFSDPLVNHLPAWGMIVVRHGYLAVDLFFVLSGYVIYITSGQSLQTGGRRVIFSFLLNRLIRIYPLHLVVMLIYILNPLALWLFSSSGVEDGRYGWDYYVASIFLVQNWGWFDHLEWNVPAWSISTEFAAYILCPLLVVVSIARIRLNAWRLLLVMLSLGVILGLIYEISDVNSIGGNISSLGLIRCILEFWMGLCLGAIGWLVHPSEGVLRLYNFFIIVLLLFVFVFLINSSISNYWFVPVVSVILVHILSRGDAVFSWLLSLKLVHYFGLISYSTYLAHFFIKDWVKFFSDSIGLMQFLYYIVACFVVSALAYKYIENPSRRFLRGRLSIGGVL